MAEDIILKGFDELDRKLHDLPDKVARRILRQSTVEAAKVIQAEAETLVRTKAKVKGGKAIRIVRSTKEGGSQVTCHITPTKKKWFLKFLETGAVIHEVTAKNAQILADWKRKLFFGKKIITNIEAKPFLRPALDVKKTQALDVLGKELGSRIEQAAMEKV